MTITLANVRHGFNRLSIVLTIGWITWLVVFEPISFRSTQYGWAAARESRREDSCREFHEPNEEGCLKAVKSDYDSDIERASLKHFYSESWWFLLLYCLVVPSLAYGGVIATAAVFIWIFRGFQKP